MELPILVYLGTHQYLFYICVFLAGLYFFLAKRYYILLGIYGGAAGLLISVMILKNLFEVARPLNGIVSLQSYSFPSGHAAGIVFISFLFCLVVTNIFKNIPHYWPVIFGILASLSVGLSRVYLNLHTPLDIIAGYAVGLFWIVLLSYFLRAVSKPN